MTRDDAYWCIEKFLARQGARVSFLRKSEVDYAVTVSYQDGRHFTYHSKDECERALQGNRR